MDSLAVSLVKTLGLKFDSGFGGEQSDDAFHELDSIFFLVDVIGYIGLGIESLSEPVENIGNEFEVGFGEVFEGDKTGVIQRSEHLAQVSALSVTHFQIDYV